MSQATTCSERVVGYDVVVLGAGLAGLVAAARAAEAGASVGIVALASGGLNLWSGLVSAQRSLFDAEGAEDSGRDSAGADRTEAGRPGRGPASGWTAAETAESARFFAAVTGRAGLPYLSASPASFTVLSPAGNPITCSMLPASAAAGDLTLWGGGQESGGGLLIAGFTELGDYPAGLISARAASRTGNRVIYRSFSLGAAVGRGLAPRLANLFDDRTWFRSFLDLSRRVLGPEARQAAAVAFPPVLGVYRFTQNLQDLAENLGCPVFELPALPPSVPGQRFWRLWRHHLERGGRTTFHLGSRVVEARVQGGRCLWVADWHRRYEGAAFVLATGGVAGGGLEVPPGSLLAQDDFPTAGAGSGRPENPREPVFGLATWGHGRDWLSWGVRTDSDLRPYPDGAATEPLGNVFAAGWQLGGANVSGAAGSIFTAWRAGGLAAAAAGATDGTIPAASTRTGERG